jgi:hypothetical protein
MQNSSVSNWSRILRIDWSMHNYSVSHQNHLFRIDCFIYNSSVSSVNLYDWRLYHWWSTRDVMHIESRDITPSVLCWITWYHPVCSGWITWYHPVCSVLNHVISPVCSVLNHVISPRLFCEKLFCGICCLFYFRFNFVVLNVEIVMHFTLFS